jgi:hypothetical protein
LERLDADHMLVIIKLSHRRTSHTSSLRRFEGERLNDENVAISIGCIRAPEQIILNVKWKRMEKALRKVPTHTIGYIRKQTVKEWFDEEGEKVNEEKNTI